MYRFVLCFYFPSVCLSLFLFIYIFLISTARPVLTDRGNDGNKDINENDNEAEKRHESVDNVSTHTGSSQQVAELEQKQDNKANEQIANDTNEARDTIDKNPIKQQEVASKYSRSSNEETLQMEEEQKLKKQKVSYLPTKITKHLFVFLLIITTTTTTIKITLTITTTPTIIQIIFVIQN